MVLSSADDVRAMCRAVAAVLKREERRPIRGCTLKRGDFTRGGSVEIWCARGDAQCLAHELRHVIEPEWRHD